MRSLRTNAGVTVPPVRVTGAPASGLVRQVLVAIVVAALAFGCGAGTTARPSPAASLDEVLLSPTTTNLLAMNVRTCATRELPIGGDESAVAFTRDHKTVATLR